ncbi:MAG: branched-chain amino acid aminotransferase [Anaeroplasmataceae bacterium]
MKFNYSILKNPIKEPNFNDLGFGKHFAPYMFEMTYTNGLGWHDATIKPYGVILMDPAQMVLHYAQETFEGLKAYKDVNNKIFLFRPYMNAKRLNKSNERLCMPIIDEDLFVKACSEVAKYNECYIPKIENYSLYIRPFVFAYESALGVRKASVYKFMIIASPVSSYYQNGIKPVNILVESEYVRAIKGGTGEAKCGGNYASSIIAQEKASLQGFDQVLWLDAIERKYIEEVGTMNVMFRINDTIITPPLDGSILPGITRDSIIQLLKKSNFKVEERKISIDELIKLHKENKLIEAFGTGTAAVITPIGKLKYKDTELIINNFKIGEVTQYLFDTLTNIQYNKADDEFNFRYEVK